ncbi:MAG TPA: hypothetical protein VHZ26_02640 [Caulobacteraceae bacterium]|jgi:hypothetical protein|nr:hypothetical protein [Caulobacteraceae bacterium]
MSADRPVTREDWEAAQAEAACWDERWANDSSNNPNKYSAQRKAARRRVHELTAALKAQGDLPMTKHERLCAELDRRFPDADHGIVVTHEGTSYRRRFYPLEKSRSRNSVTRWGRSWERA